MRLTRWLVAVAALVAGLVFGSATASAATPHAATTHAGTSSAGSSATGGMSALDWWWT